MRGISLRFLTGAVSALLLGAVIVGCGGGTRDDDDERLARSSKKSKSTGGAATSGPATKLTMLGQDKYKYEGVIKGHIKWVGAKPNLEEATQKLRAGMTTNKDYCLQGKDYETTEQSFRIGANDRLGNVFVWIQAPQGHAFDVPDSQLPAVKDVRLHQPHCAFLPHCTVLFPRRYKNGEYVSTGQHLVVENDARVTHNAKVGGGPLNPVRDILMPAWSGEGKVREEVFQLKTERDPITVSCGVHGWMRGYIRTFDHPYAAVSSVGANLSDAKNRVFENDKDPNFGSFEIKGVPIGAKVRLFAWHEELKHLLGNSGEEITIEPAMEKVIEAKLK
jgi:hypothetical protein